MHIQLENALADLNTSANSKKFTVLCYVYNLIWTYFPQNRSQWQQHMKEFVITLYCEIANSFGEDASKVSIGRQQVVTGLTDVCFITTCHTSPTPYLEYFVRKLCGFAK